LQQPALHPSVNPLILSEISKKYTDDSQQPKERINMKVTPFIQLKRTVITGSCCMSSQVAVKVNTMNEWTTLKILCTAPQRVNIVVG
jgi:hypothetical protein